MKKYLVIVLVSIANISFSQSSIGIKLGGANFIGMLIYPNLNYCILNKRVKVSVSAGAYFAFRKYTNSVNDNNMEFEGDVIPGGGIGISYKL